MRAPLWQAQHPETKAASISGFLCSHLVIKYPPSSNVKGKLTVLRDSCQLQLLLTAVASGHPLFTCVLSSTAGRQDPPASADKGKLRAAELPVKWPCACS